MQANSYMTKKILYNKELKSIITQNLNGPCPLLAIANLLILQDKMFLHTDYSCIFTDQLVSMILECLLDLQANKIQDENWNYRLNEAMSLIHKYEQGMDVNVKFDKVDSFEFTADCEIFEVLDIKLLHGWLPETYEETKALGNFTYNQAIDYILSKTDDRGRTIREFFDKNASQLTEKGLQTLKTYMQNDQLAVLFRNNHFSTIKKHNDEVFILATDVAFTETEEIVWEWLNEVNGNNPYCTSDFIPLNMYASSMGFGGNLGVSGINDKIAYNDQILDTNNQEKVEFKNQNEVKVPKSIETDQKVVPVENVLTGNLGSLNNLEEEKKVENGSVEVKKAKEKDEVEKSKKNKKCKKCSCTVY
ncbi:hypothetical protein SteCoe_30816 [Stentor coeruleus]|uniref:MINDY deubiquitinase domain-containing protein n=1 Tax=Stentor coeruleus TaxID=5963 RepID=A0A1R2B361_9CILI|nr:hypothetical protein SteCoe_30816 [Stentor coeruleus]